VEAKWTVVKFMSGGVLIGTIFLFGFMELNQSVENTVGTRSANSLSAENDILRQQIDLIAPRLKKLEAQAGQLRDRSDELQKHLDQRQLVGDTIVRIPKATTGSKLLSLVASSKRPRP
jgi:hypothetical protein